ncbi:MAG: hypothetical protein HOW73_21830 [Polyangiaceae bacterium]|nr:hypothetical protein [Polyangiaceae bacterium]
MRERIVRWLRSPWLGVAITAFAFVLGVLWRWAYVLKVHRPTDFVYSDMKMYVELGKRFAREGYVLKPHDVTHPPGLSELIAYFYRSDPTLANMVRVHFWLTILVPLAVGALGWIALDRRAGLWSLAVTSLYFPFIDYGGYFLAEIYITLLATLTLVCYFGAIRLWPTRPAKAADEPAETDAARTYRDAPDAKPSASPTARERLFAFLGAVRTRIGLAVVVSLLGGVLFSLAMLMKMVAAPAMLGFFAVHILFTRARASWRAKSLVVALFIVAALPLCKWQADRCTRGNDGKFCPGSNKAPADFLMGHIGRVQSVTWRERDPKNPERIRGQVNFGSPAAYQHGYSKKVEFDFKITDGEKNKEAAWKWIGENPGQAVVLSFEHVWDSFGGSLPWPTVATKHWAWSQTFHYVFLIFIFIPSVLLLIDRARIRGLVGLLRSTELALFAPIIGVIVSVMMATGEVRYRIPWDMCFILLAVQFYRELKIPLREQPASPARE